jgi:hypothetical protein
MRKPWAQRQQTNLSPATRWRPAYEPEPALVLAKVTGATAISNYRWTYSWEEATVTGTTPSTRAQGLTGNALSVSELSNGAPPTTYAYGVPSVDLPAGFAPKAIPMGTYVILSAFRRSDGSLMWLIINTQAISGTCP